MQDSFRLMDGAGDPQQDMENQKSLQDFNDSTEAMLNASLVEEQAEDVGVQVGETYLQPNVKWLWLFPGKWDKKLKPLDDPIIELCQRFRGKAWKYFSLAVTGSVAIEIAIAVPYVLFFVGYDGIATEFVYLALILALFSQIPKRFVWRLRPYMAGRAIKVKKDLTSSFPSRAVTCAAVYSFAIAWTWMYIYTREEGTPTTHFVFMWWMPLLFVSAILLASFARINLGVHYPSDCIGGLVQGILVCLIGTLLWRTDIVGCTSCHLARCYAASPDVAITLKSGASQLNWWLVSVMAVVVVGVPVLSVAKPIDFWSKCDRVYGMLLPGIAFQVLLLCPNSSRKHPSILPPDSPKWYSFVLAILLVVSATLAGVKFGGKRPLMIYFILFLSLFSSLLFWRLS